MDYNQWPTLWSIIKFILKLHIQMQEDQSKLSSAKVRNMLKLQQLFHNRFLTVQLLHELISLYTCCIESIDESQQDLRNYFLQKIQFVLSRQEMQALLNAVNNIEDKNFVENLRETIRDTKRDEISFHANTQFLKPNYDKKKLYSYDGDKPDQKKKKIDIQLQLMAQMQNNMKNITNQVNAADLKIKNQNIRIRELEYQQNSKLQQRLAKRKNKKRKQSVDQKNEGSPVKMNKVDLLKVQNQINQAVQRFTIRTTQRQKQKQLSKNANTPQQKQPKGRINKIKRQEQD